MKKYVSYNPTTRDLDKLRFILRLSKENRSEKANALLSLFRKAKKEAIELTGWKMTDEDFLQANRI